MMGELRKGLNVFGPNEKTPIERKKRGERSGERDREGGEREREMRRV